VKQKLGEGDEQALPGLTACSAMSDQHQLGCARIWFALFWLFALATLPARGQTASAKLSINLTVQSSISLVFNNNPNVGKVGFCPLTNAGTNNVGLDFGAAAFPGSSSTFPCVSYTHLNASFYQVSSAFDVLVTKSNSSSSSYRLAAQISTAPPTGVIWLLNNVTLNNTALTTLDTADSYGQPVTKALQVQVRNNVASQILQETITFVATAN
jgi:hypothetical protein